MSSQTFTSSGSFTVPAGVNHLTVECTGAGGSGCSAPVNGGGGGGGGGGGAYTLATVSVTAGATYSVTVGAGGITASGDGGTGGGDSVVATPTEVRASGGFAAIRTAIGSGGFSSATYIGGDGGSGADATSQGGGGGGGAASSGGAGTSGDTSGSLGVAVGGSFGGGDGGQCFPSLQPGTSGSAPGGGGGGGAVRSGIHTSSGGNGADGQVTITWTVDATIKTITGTSLITGQVVKTITGTAFITSIPQSGYNVIRMAVPPAAGKSLQVTYYRLGQDLIVCEDTALVAARALAEGSTGAYHQLAQDSSNTNMAAGIQETQQALSTYSKLPITIKLETLRPGLLPGQYLTIFADGLAAWNLPSYINGRWLIQQVDARYIPAMQGARPGITWDEATFTWVRGDFPWDAMDGYEFGPMIYTLTLTSVPTIANWVNDLERLAQKKP